MFGLSRTGLAAAGLLLGGLGASYLTPHRLRLPPRRILSRRHWLRYRATKKSYDLWAQIAKRKAQRRARRATRLGRK